MFSEFSERFGMCVFLVGAFYGDRAWSARLPGREVAVAGKLYALGGRIRGGVTTETVERSAGGGAGEHGARENGSEPIDLECVCFRCDALPARRRRGSNT